jgi:hypothetical protein
LGAALAHSNMPVKKKKSKAGKAGGGALVSGVLKTPKAGGKKTTKSVRKKPDESSLLLVSSKTYSKLSTIKSSPSFGWGSIKVSTNSKADRLLARHRERKVTPGALKYSEGVQRYYQIGRVARGTKFGGLPVTKKDRLERLDYSRPDATSYADGTARYFRFGGEGGKIMDSTVRSVKTVRFGPGLADSLQQKMRPSSAPLKGRERKEMMMTYTLPNTRSRLENSQPRPSSAAASGRSDKVQKDRFRRAPTFAFGPGFGRPASKSKVQKQELSSSSYVSKFGIQAKHSGGFAPVTCLNAKQLARFHIALNKDKSGHANFIKKYEMAAGGK